MPRPPHPIGRAAVLLACALVALASTPAVAGIAVFGQHDTRVGQHWVLDGPGPNLELPAVTCRYVDDELVRMTIRQPVIFAYTGGGPQGVGWQARIDWADATVGPWHTYASTPVSQATATRRRPADLAPKHHEFPANVEQHQYYRVVYRLLWYEPGDPTAKAIHFNPWYRVSYDGGTWVSDGACTSQLIHGAASTRAPAPPYGEGIHEGLRGLHWILDSFGAPPEYPAVTCIYDGTGQLEALRIRRPIVFARDRGPGLDRQDVGWKVVIQSTLSTGPEAWSNVDQSSVARKRTSDAEWADFGGLTVDLPEDGLGVAVRVVYRMYWYQGDSTSEANRAVHWPYWYGLDADGGPDSRFDYCHTFLT